MTARIRLSAGAVSSSPSLRNPFRSCPFNISDDMEPSPPGVCGEETHRTTEPDVQRPIQKSITQKLVQLSRGAPLGRSVSEEQGGLRATALASPRGPPAALSADRPGCLAGASDQKARSDSAVETQALGPEATRAPSSARAPKGCAARPARRERRSPSRATADLVRAPRRPVPPAAVHTPGGLAPRLSSPGPAAA